MGGVDRNLSGFSHDGRDVPFTPPTGPNPRRDDKRGSKLAWASARGGGGGGVGDEKRLLNESGVLFC